MTTLTRHTEPSPAQIAAALEQFEIQQLKDQLRQQRIAHTEELSAAKRQAEQEPLERMIDRWNGYPGAIERARYAEAELAKARAEHALVTESLTTAMENAAKYQQLAEHYQRQCEQAIATSNANNARADDAMRRFQQQVRELNTQLRIYREMNPDKLKKQVKRLQDKNKELTARNETAIKNAEQLKKDKAKLAQDLERERIKSRNLKDSLDDASDALNDADKRHRIRYGYIDETWGITGSGREDLDTVFIEHFPSGQRRALSVSSGDMIRTEPVPAAIKSLAIQVGEKYIKAHAFLEESDAPAEAKQEAS